MNTPDQPFDVVTVSAETTLNGRTISIREPVSPALWDSLVPAFQEGIKTNVRNDLGKAMVAALDIPVTVTRGEPEVMRTSAAPLGHGGSRARGSESDWDAALSEGAGAVFALDFDLKRDGYEFDSHRQAWELGTIDSAEQLLSMLVRPVNLAAIVARVERGRAQLVEAMSAVSEDRHCAGWLEGLDRRLHCEGGMWETLGRAYGWPVGDWEKWTWMTWDAAGALYTGRAATDG